MILCAESIRIYHGVGVREKSVPRITLWHHEACRVMPDRDREGRIFLSTPHTNDRFFSCTSFISECRVLIMQSLRSREKPPDHP